MEIVIFYLLKRYVYILPVLEFIFGAHLRNTYKFENSDRVYFANNDSTSALSLSLSLAMNMDVLCKPVQIQR